MIYFIIPGRPFAKQRPRFSRSSGHAFTPGETVSFERQVGIIASQLFPEPLSGPVLIQICAVFSPPVSASKKRRVESLGRPHTQKPDLDNIVKAITDGLNRIAFADDSQIAAIHASKTWGEAAETVVHVSGLNERP